MRDIQGAIAERLNLVEKVMTVFIKAWRYYRYAGLAGLALRIRRAIWSREQYVIFNKELISSSSAAHDDDVEFRLATREDLPALCRVWPEGLRYVGPDVSSALSRRLDVGEVCVLGYVADRHEDPIMFCWLSWRDSCLLTLLGPLLPEGHACIKNLWVSPNFRRKQIAVRGERFLSEAAYRRGVRTLWVFIMSGNKISRHMHDRLGFQNMGSLTFYEKFGWRGATLEQDGTRRRLALCPPGKSVL